MSDAIVVQNLGEVTLSLTPEFHQIKADALAKAKDLPPVTDEATQALATQVLSEIKGICKRLESSRTEVKKPVIELGRNIDTIAKQAIQDLTDTATKIHREITDYYRAENAKAEAARRMQESLDAKRRAREAEAGRKADEERVRLEQEAAMAKGAQAEDLLKAAEAKQAEAQAAKAKAQLSQAPVASAPKAEKMTVRKVWKHEVVDIKSLYAARPELVTLEPKTNAILAEIRGGMTQCPGLKIWQEDEVVVRT